MFSVFFELKLLEDRDPLLPTRTLAQVKDFVDLFRNPDRRKPILVLVGGRANLLDNLR